MLISAQALSQWVLLGENRGKPKAVQSCTWGPDQAPEGPGAAVPHVVCPD